MDVKKYFVRSVLLGSFLVAFSACEKKENPFPDHEGGQIFQGLKKVNVNCSGCHGPLGGGGMRAPSLTKSVRNLPPDQFIVTVAKGRGGMPAFDKVLQEEETRQIMDWLQKLPD